MKWRLPIFLTAVLSLCFAAGAIFLGREGEGTPRAAAPPFSQRAGREGEVGQSGFFEIAASLEDPAAREEVLQGAIRGMKVSQIRNALASIQDPAYQVEFRSDVEARLVRRWAEIDLATAAGFVLAMPAGTARGLVLEQLAIVGAGKDLGTAMAWAESLPEGPERDLTLSAVAGEAVRTRPVDALRIAAGLPESAANDELIRRAAMEWTAADQPAALAWGRQIEDEGFRIRVLGGMVTAWAEREPAAAATFVADEFPPGRVLDDAVIGIAQRWVQKNPVAATAWIDTFPPGTLRDAAVEAVAPIWAKADPEAAGRWKSASREKSQAMVDRLPNP